jgi:hypothetical protein
VVRTMLVEMLIKCDELHRMHDVLAPCLTKTDLEEKIADCEAILKYLEERFTQLHRGYSELYAHSPAAFGREASAAEVGERQPELVAMADEALLRYGTILKYIVLVEASLQDAPLDTYRTKLREAQMEWRRRFGGANVGELELPSP